MCVQAERPGINYDAVLGACFGRGCRRESSVNPCAAHARVDRGATGRLLEDLYIVGGQRRPMFCKKRKNRFVPRGTGPKKGVGSSEAISKILAVPRETSRRLQRRPISRGTKGIFEMTRGTKRLFVFLQNKTKKDAFALLQYCRKRELATHSICTHHAKCHNDESQTAPGA